MMPHTVQPNWPAPAWIKAHTTVRHSWGALVEESEQQPTQNQHCQGHTATQSLIDLLDLPATPCWIKQKHTDIAIEAHPNTIDDIADASFTAMPNRVCAILTADCLPIFLCDRQGTKVAAIHAGWRGLAKGIIKTTVSALQLPPEEILAWLGPAIGPQYFEVGSDVYDAFTQQDSSMAIAFKPIEAEQKWLANLYLLAILKLNQLGVSHVYGEDHCTYRDDHLFYSYRRDQGKTGRMASVIWIAQT